MIDATEFVTPATNIKLGFHKVAKYIIMPGLHSPSHMNEAVFKLETWNKMSKRIRDLISAAGELSAFQTAMTMGAQDFDAMEKLLAGKNEFITLTPEAQARIEELGRAWCAEQAKAQKAKGNDWMERISGNYWAFYDRYKKYGVYRHN